MKVTDLKEKEVIHCKTEEEANTICKLIHEAGFNWDSGSSYLKDNGYIQYGVETCYRPFVGKCAHLNYYIDKDYTIYKASKFIEDMEKTTEQKINILQEELDDLKKQYKEDNTFEIGDIVVKKEDFTSRGYMGNKNYGGVWFDKLPSIFKVDSLDNNEASVETQGDKTVNGVVVYSKSLRKATLQEIEEYNNRNSLPKIGCREGEVTERHIKYGDVNLSKKTLQQMERVGIKSFTVEYDLETFRIAGEDLQRIFKACK